MANDNREKITEQQSEVYDEEKGELNARFHNSRHRWKDERWMLNIESKSK